MITWGWETFKLRWQMLVGVTAVFFLIQMGIGAIVDLFPRAAAGHMALWSLGVFVNLVLSGLASVGLITFALRAHDEPDEASVFDLWNPMPIWRYLGASILSGLAIFIGVLLLVVPGIIAALSLSFATALVVDRALGPIEAMKESKHITKGNRLELLWLFILIAGINLLGALALLVGLLVSVPVSFLAMTHAYRLLAADASAPEPLAS